VWSGLRQITRVASATRNAVLIMELLGPIVITALVVEIVMGSFGAWVAIQKRREPSEGFVLGLLFGPLGVLVEAMLPVGERQTVQPSPAVTSSSGRVVAFAWECTCGGKPQRHNCDKCGAWKCNRCGTINPKGGATCSTCRVSEAYSMQM
jgi:hypothetical protein